MRCEIGNHSCLVTEVKNYVSYVLCGKNNKAEFLSFRTFVRLFKNHPFFTGFETERMLEGNPIADIKAQINLEKLPRHIAVIMDGNGRWAKQHGKPRVFGHRNGVRAVRETTESAAELGLEYLTLYAFSTENWGRPHTEVNALMHLLVETIHSEMHTLLKNNIRLQAIGDIRNLPEATYRSLLKGIEQTRDNNRMTLVLALNYSSKWEIVNAVQTIANAVKTGELNPEQIDETIFANALTTRDIPDPELLIRTSGETRLSNFLLWQAAYAELYFTSVLWPDFRKQHLYEAIVNYQNRERRFGKISEQIKV